MWHSLWPRGFMYRPGFTWHTLRLESAVPIIITLCILIFSFFNPQTSSVIRMKMTDIFAPVLSLISTPLEEGAVFLRTVMQLSEIQEENKQLKEENEKLREWYQSAIALEAENKSLRQILNAQDSPNFKFITARVLADSNKAFIRTILISAGQNQGIQKGNAVLSGYGLIGRVIETGEKTARVLLLTDVNSRVQILFDTTLQHGILAGNNTDYPTLIHMPQNSKIEDGGKLITSGHGGLFPYGLPIGRVILKDNQPPKVELYENSLKLLHVRILISSE